LAFQKSSTFVFSETSPHPIRFFHCQGMLEAFLAYWACSTYLLGCLLTTLTRFTALPFWVKENLGVNPAAGGFELPIPEIGIGSW
jgi:hypothetical protein